MNEIKTTTNLVKQVLEEVPAARNNDMYLYMEVVRKINSSLLRVPIAVFIDSMEKYNLPTPETVGRCRRKIQSECPDLRAKKAVEKFRSEREGMFREWAGEHNA